MLTTTLNEIRVASPCKDSWQKLLKHLGKTGQDDEVLPVATIIEANGIDDALWVITRACGEKGRAIGVTFAADCAERVLPVWEAAYPDDGRPRAAIAAARCAAHDAVASAAAGNAAIDAAIDAAHDAVASAAACAYTAAYAARSAACSAYAAAYAGSVYAAPSAATYAIYASADDECAWQAAHLRKLIEGDE